MSATPPDPRNFPPDPPPLRPDEKVYPPIYHRGWIYFLLFVVIGPFALPILFRSPFFTSKEKKVITVIAIFYFILMIILLVCIIGFYFYIIATQLEGL